MINAKEGDGKGDKYILDCQQNIDSPIFLIINKVDLIHPDELFPIIELYKDKCNFEEIIPISALQGNNVTQLLDILKKYLPEGPKYHAEDQVTDHPERFIKRKLIIQ